MKPDWEIYAEFGFVAVVAVLMLAQIHRHAEYRTQCADQWASAKCANLGGSLQ